MTKQTLINICGLLGVLGGAVLFGGDMLLYFSEGNRDLGQVMGAVAPDRIIASTATALLAGWLYVAGSVQVFFAFETSKPVLRYLVSICMAAIAVGYAVVHGAYTAIATSAQLATTHGLDLAAATSLALEANEVLRTMIMPIFLVLSLVFLHQVWTRKTRYPRWMLLFYPLALFLLQGPITGMLDGTAWVIISGGYLNLQMLIFFAASTVALWRRFED